MPESKRKKKMEDRDKGKVWKRTKKKKKKKKKKRNVWIKKNKVLFFYYFIKILFFYSSSTYHFFYSSPPQIYQPHNCHKSTIHKPTTYATTTTNSTTHELNHRETPQKLPLPPTLTTHKTHGTSLSKKRDGDEWRRKERWKTHVKEKIK